MKSIDLKPGKYVLAVSGGVDSMALLDLLSNLPGVELVVGHFNHGIRPDSAVDEDLVTEAASRYGWPLEIGHGKLGAKASEDTARRARYEFLETVKREHTAKKIITAHHQDDLIETALINLLRGTGRRGLTALADNSSVVRPLLGIRKTEIIQYAHRRKLNWREDSTNQSTDYLRNYLRLKILIKLDDSQREKLIADLAKISQLNPEIDKRLADLGKITRPVNEINRLIFAGLPDKVADELLAHWLRAGRHGEIDAYEISRLKLAIKAAKPDTVHPVRSSSRLVVKARSANFQSTS